IDGANARTNGSHPGRAAAGAPTGPNAHHSTVPVTQLPSDLEASREASIEAAKAAHPLAHFYQGLARLEDDPKNPAIVRITQIGDSHTASDTFTGPLRHALQKRFGDGGRGYL